MKKKNTHSDNDIIFYIIERIMIFIPNSFIYMALNKYCTLFCQSQTQ